MAEHTAAPSQAQLEDSQSSIRATTKWLVAAAAAVGAVAVAGLQLSKLPHGTLATIMVFVGFVLALVGVAWVIFSAASVLSIGYTNLSQLSELYNPEALRQARVRILEDKIAGLRLLGKKISSRHYRIPLSASIQRAINNRKIRSLEKEEAGIPLEKDKGVEIAEMLDYLEKDTPIFTGFLAANIPDLYRLIETTDKEILRIREEHAGGRPEGLAGQEAELTPRRRLLGRSRQPRKSSGLAEAEWRAAKLETAAGQLIAFANQKIIEQQFSTLKRSVKFGGILVIFGVGIFAGAQKAATPNALSITQPTKVTVVVKNQNAFGSNCKETQFSAVAIGGTWDKPIITDLPLGGCHTGPLTLKSGDGYVVPIGSPSPAPTP